MDKPPSCHTCGGYGKGLIRTSESICAHCARQTSFYFNPSLNAYCKDHGYIDISPNADGGILKKVIRPGISGENINEGCLAVVQYIGRLTDTKSSIFDTTRDVVDGKNVGGTDDPFEFRIGHGKVISGWDIGVYSMQKNELSRFILNEKYAYGQDGYAPRVEPYATLDYEIELVEIGTSLPKFPSQEELAASKAKRLEEDQKIQTENPPPSIEERIRDSGIEKENGNKLVAQKEYEAARQAYDGAFVYLFISKEEWATLTDEEKNCVTAAKLPLHLNRALCKIKLDKIDDALWDCDQAIALNEHSLKGHFRRALVFMSKLKRELHKEEENIFWMIDKAQGYEKEAKESLQKVDHFELMEKMERADWSKDETTKKSSVTSTSRVELYQSSCLLRRYEEEYKMQEKNLYRNKMIGGLQRSHAREKEGPVVTDAFADMPPLGLHAPFFRSLGFCITKLFDLCFF